MTNATTKCTRCGKTVPPQSRFCLECGSDLTGVSDAGTTKLAATQVDPRASDQALLETLRQATLGVYDVVAEVGKGGMANVYLAHDIALDRKVAIKVISPELLRSGQSMAERFQREARTAASLSHPHIIPIYAVKESERILFFVMKFVEGRALESVVREEGQLPVPMVQTILNQVGSALDYAHTKGVIHRDIKPGNIMLDEGGWAVVTDFGIAKVTEADGLTMTGATVGTPTYMSPEQCAGMKLTGAVDQYALGVVAYEMLTGQLPFKGESAMTVMYKHTHEPPPPIHQTWPECPRPLGNAVMRMLSKAPEDRFPTMAAAVEAIGVGEMDDTIRTRLVSLARSGGNQALLAQFQTPKSSVPRPDAFKTRGTPTGISIPQIEDSGAGSSGVQSGEAASLAIQRSKSKLLWGVPVGVGVLSAAVWAVLTLGGGPSNPGTTAQTNPPVPQGDPVSPASATTSIARLEVGPATVNIERGGSTMLTAIATDSSGTAIQTPDVTFASRNPTVASVSSDGLVTALSGGQTQIVARVGTHSVTVPVNVATPTPPRTSGGGNRPAPARVARVAVNPSRSTARVGDEITLVATATDGSGSALADRSPVWMSSDNRVATVVAGRVRAVGEGTASIIASVDGFADTVAVTVAPVAVGAIVVSPSTNTLNNQESVQLDARVTDESGSELRRTVTWSSNNPSIARVTTSGRVTALSAGTATITASVDGRQATSQVTVRTAEPRQADPPANDPAEDRRQIQALVEQYRAAIQAKNINQLRTIYPQMPNVDENNFASFFNTVDDLTVRTTISGIDLQDDQANVTIDVLYSFRASGRGQQTDFVARMTVQRQGSNWRIVRLDSSQ